MFAQLPFWKESEPDPCGQVNDFLIGDRLYNGPYSVVFRATAVRGPHVGKTVALKFLKHRQHIFEGPRIRREVQLLKILRHPNIVPILEEFSYNCFHCVVSPFAEHGTLESYAFRSKMWLTADQTRAVAVQLLKALAHVHRMGFVHCDVKPENILVHSVVGGRPQIWLCDFGLTKMISESASLGGIRGTELYQAPEIFNRKGFNEKVDEWAGGVVLHRLLTGVGPFMSRSQMNERVLEANFKGVLWGRAAETAKGLVRGLLALDPGKRISAEEALKDGWLHPLTEEIQERCEECLRDAPAEGSTTQAHTVFAQ
jgi:serine/threonine protein kinase